MDYAPGHFISTYNTHNGQQIWSFLNEHDNVIRMETATYLSRPAAEPLSPHLVEKFGLEIGADSIKKMIGHMIRQIMERNNRYRFDRSGVPITRPDNIFSSAARYCAAMD